ncbi:TRAP transporter small permease subunit [Nocardia rhamnosiphila]|uniref:TRAP transporter small permease n=1 Tax=Nocardia rhamnosiphila TaxID=426716 RepID=A0ABV2WYU5_9NOCA
MTAATRTDRPAPVWVRCIRGISTVMAIPAAIACMGLMIHVIGEVLGRNLFNHPLPGTLEITQYWWMMTIVFLAFGYTQLRGDHIRATVITEMLDARWERAAQVLALFLLGGFAVFLGVHGWTSAVSSMEIRDTSTGAQPIPIWPMVFAVPLGCAALTMQCVASIYAVATGRNPASHAEELI